MLNFHILTKYYNSLNKMSHFCKNFISSISCVLHFHLQCLRLAFSLTCSMELQMLRVFDWVGIMSHKALPLRDLTLMLRVTNLTYLLKTILAYPASGSKALSSSTFSFLSYPLSPGI